MGSSRASRACMAGGCAALAAACARRAPPAVAPLADRPAGWACATTSTVPGARPAAFVRARAALATLGVRAARVDSAGGLLDVGGAGAPAGRGSAAQRAARLYLRLAFEPDSGGRTPATAVSGVYAMPAAVSRTERDALYEQAAALGRAVVTQAGWPDLACTLRAGGAAPPNGALQPTGRGEHAG